MYLYLAICGASVCLLWIIAIIRWGFEVFMSMIIGATVYVVRRQVIKERERQKLLGKVNAPKPQAYYSNRR